MKILASWLREFVSPKVTNTELAHTLTMSGLEVDGVFKIAPEFSGVVVGEVLSCEKHPNADKLNICQVNIGNNISQIICGANNVRANIKVPVATVGSVLPSNFKIKKAKLRGVESEGMICSKAELGLSDSAQGILHLDSDAPIGKNIREYLNLDDEIIDIDITPNRGDCFSILGVAREVSVNYNIPLTVSKYSSQISSNTTINANVTEPIHCPKYLVRVIENIDNNINTPKWMADKLSRSGFALHSVIVDVTNFVLLELGQPMHAFDYAKVDTALDVRLSKDNEQIELLNGDTITIKPETLVIADNFGAIALAGIMGGMSTSTTTDTTTIILESAFFDNINIAGKAREHGLHTESSLRFERGVDFNLAEIALNRATNLILEICGGNAGEVSAVIDEKAMPKRLEVCVNTQKINATLGFDVKREWIEETLQNLDFKIIDSSQDSITIIPPSFRFDISIDVDLIEELARIYGYDKLPTKSLHIASSLTQIPTHKDNLLSTLVGLGYNEVINYSFISKDLANIFGGNIELLNPISSDMGVMRGSLLAGLVKTAIYNKRYGINHLKIFETGLCFDSEQIDGQIEKIAGLITGSTLYNHIEKNREFDFFDIKADIEALINCKVIASNHEFLQPGQCADIILNDKVIGLVGSIHPSITNSLGLGQCYVFEMVLEPLLRAKHITYQHFAHYQSSVRDISILINKKYLYNEVYSKIIGLNQEFLSDAQLVDIWQDESMPEYHHSLTFSLTYQSDSKTLTDEEMDNAVTEVVTLLKIKFNAQQR